MPGRLQPVQAAETSSHWRTVGDETLKPTALKTLAVSRFLSFVDNNKIAGALSVVRATIMSFRHHLGFPGISENFRNYSCPSNCLSSCRVQSPQPRGQRCTSRSVLSTFCTEIWLWVMCERSSHTSSDGAPCKHDRLLPLYVILTQEANEY